MSYVKVKVRNVHKPELEAEMELLAETGAIYAIIKREKLQKLNIEAKGKRRFKTADGRVIEREVGAAEIEIKGQSAYSVVVFGERSDAGVLSVASLEELGLQVDPTTGELKPLELLLLSLEKYAKCSDMLFVFRLENNLQKCASNAISNHQVKRLNSIGYTQFLLGRDVLPL